MPSPGRDLRRDEKRAQWLARCILPHEAELRAWLRPRTHGQLEVDDVVQEAYAVLAGLDSVAHIHNARAYLFTTARSIVLQHIRRARLVQFEQMAEIERPGIDTEQRDRADNPEAVTGRAQKLRQVEELIAGLPGKCREAFVLRKIHGYSQREIAERMGIAESTVEKHIGKGLRRLMQAMAGTAGDDDGSAQR